MFLMFQYIHQICLFSLTKLVPIVEMYYVSMGIVRKASHPKTIGEGERVSAIACMSVQGILDVKVVKGTSNSDTFYDFLHTHLLPYLL